MAPDPPENDPSEGSWLTFGGLNSELKPDDKDWIAHRIAGSFHWQTKLNSIKYNDIEIRPEFPMILTDTGTTITYLRSKEFDELLPLVCPNCTFNEQMGLYQLDVCNTDAQQSFKPIWFKLDSSYYEMPVSSYL